MTHPSSGGSGGTSTSGSSPAGSGLSQSSHSTHHMPSRSSGTVGGQQSHGSFTGGSPQQGSQAQTGQPEGQVTRSVLTPDKPQVTVRYSNIPPGTEITVGDGHETYYRQAVRSTTDEGSWSSGGNSNGGNLPGGSPQNYPTHSPTTEPANSSAGVNDGNVA